MSTRAAAKRAASMLQTSVQATCQSALTDSFKANQVLEKSTSTAPETVKLETTTQQKGPSKGAKMAPQTSISSKRKRKVAQTDSVQDEELPHGLGAKSNWSMGNDLVLPETTESLKEHHVKQESPPPTRRKRRALSDINSSNIKIEEESAPLESHSLSTDDSPSSKHLLPTPCTIKDEEKQQHNPPKVARKAKAHPYGLTPGKSPFPDFEMPTPAACEEVNRLLSNLHGKYQAPAVIPPPSLTVSGCGEVPDLLEAILRTLLSASTTSRNANMAFDGLVKAFGQNTSSSHKKSLNWDAVRQADLNTVIESIKRGGLARVKGTNIKKILDTVYAENRVRQDALFKEKLTGETADIVGAKTESFQGKEMEMSRTTDADLLSLDHIFELSNEDAMTEMTKLPGIGVKTASCVMLFCMKRPSFAVDTHVWRHCKWLGWVPPSATRDQTFSHCEVRIPDHLKYSLHQLFLQHGKKCPRCRANTSAGTEEWKQADCPIEHLVSRNETRKQLQPKPTKAKSTVARIKRRKMAQISTSESESDSFSDA